MEKPKNFSASADTANAMSSADTNKGRDENRKPSTVNIDIDRFQKMIDDPSMSEEQKRQFLLSLWSLLVICVDLKYDLKSSDPREHRSTENSHTPRLRE